MVIEYLLSFQIYLMPSIVIKTAKEDQSALIANLSWQTFFDTYHQQNSKEDMEIILKQHFCKEAVQKELDDPSNIFLLAYLGRQVVGYAKLSDSKSPKNIKENTIEIARIYSVKEKIGSGVGKALIKQCIAIAEERKKEMIWLGVWEQNQRAIQFYRRFGFEKFGEQSFMLGNDKQNDWLMKKSFNRVDAEYLL